MNSSKELRQQQFLHKEKQKQVLLYTCRLLLIIGFFSIWEISARTGILNEFIFSSPSRVLMTLKEFYEQDILFLHIGTTLSETMLSFILVTFLGILTAIFLWRFSFVYLVLEPVLILLNSLPKSALAPLLIVWLGNKPRTIIVVAVSLAIFSCVLTLYNAFSQIDPDKIKLIRSLNGNRFHIVQKVLLPASIPVFISNMKVNIGLCLVGVIIGEFLAARQGLGYLILYSSQIFRMDWVVTSILILCVIAILLYVTIAYAEKLYQNHYLKQ